MHWEIWRRRGGQGDGQGDGQGVARSPLAGVGMGRTRRDHIAGRRSGQTMGQ